jgi:hypothetical protein
MAFWDRDQISVAEIKDLLRSERIEAISLDERPPGTGVSPGEAVDGAASTFAAFSPQKPEVHLIRITENPDEPEFVGAFYAFQLDGLGPGPVVREDPGRYLVLVDAQDGSRTMGFPLER